MGVLTATDYWQEFPTPLTANVIRVTYSGAIPEVPNGIRGFLRLRYSADTFSARWYKLYPKRVESEVYRLTFEFIPDVDETITIQIRKWVGRPRSIVAEWAIRVEQLETQITQIERTVLIFGDESNLLLFGDEFTTFG